MEKQLTHVRTSVYSLNYHIVWRTKYRKPCLWGEIASELKIILNDIASRKGFSIPHLEIGKDDHIHVLVSAPPKTSVSEIVKWLKGESSLELFRAFPEELKVYYWDNEKERHLWSPGYFVESIGTTNIDAVRKYIDEQRLKEEGCSQ
jgi:putative transposase